MTSIEEAQDDLKDALREHLKMIINNSMALVVDDKSLDEAVGKYKRGLRFIRRFHEKASAVIAAEFSDG